MEPRLVECNSQIADLCRRHAVTRLEVFGSAASGPFDPARSDYDFIARFSKIPELSMGQRFIAFVEALEALLGRKVDLMTDHPIENPYLRASINATRTAIYDESAAELLV